MPINTERANEARKLADAAQDLLPGEGVEFPLDEQFRGGELDVIEGARNILNSEGDTNIKLTTPRVGFVAIQA